MAVTKTTVNNNNNYMGYVVIALLVLGGVYVGMQNHAVGGTTNTNNTTNYPDQTPVLSLQASAYDFSKAIATLSPIATTYQVYESGSSIAMASGSTTTNSLVSISGVNYGSSYNTSFGDNSGEYIQVMSKKVVKAVQDFKPVMVNIVSPTVTYNNDTVAGYSTSGGKIFGVANGYPITDLTIRIKEGNGSYGNPDSALVFAYSPTEISGITGVPGSSVTIPTGMLSIPAGYQVQAFQMTGFGPNSQTDINPTITTGTLPSNTAVPSTLHVYIVSQATFNNHGVGQPGLLVDPVNKTALVTPVTAANVLIYG
jgi:hypothetical protein